MSPIVSIIIPVYNGKAHVSRCLSSVFAQSYDNLQLIIVDDGSTDDSFSYIKEWIAAQDRSDIDVVLHKKENGGIADARNVGISLATGTYLMFADHDDTFIADYCKIYVDAIEDADADLIVGGYERVQSDGSVILQVSLEDTAWSKYVVLAPWAHIYRTSFIKEHEISFLNTPIGEDVYFNLTAYAKANKVSCISDVGYKWLFNESSVSNSRQNTITADKLPLHLLEEVMRNIQGTGFAKDSLTEYFFARYICWYLLFSSRGSKKSEIIGAFDRLHGWLKKYYPDYQNNPYLTSKMPQGEPKRFHRYVRLYYGLYRMGCLKTLLTLFGTK